MLYSETCVRGMVWRARGIRDGQHGLGRVQGVNERRKSKSLHNRHSAGQWVYERGCTRGPVEVSESGWECKGEVQEADFIPSTAKNNNKKDHWTNQEFSRHSKTNEYVKIYYGHIAIRPISWEICNAYYLEEHLSIWLLR